MDKQLKGALRASYGNSAQERQGGKLPGWKISELNRFVDAVPGNAKVLDIGSGAGFQALHLTREGLQVSCIDLCPELVAGCKELGLEARVMDFYQPEFPPQTFQALWAMNTLLHVPKKNLPLVLENLKALLVPGGIFYLGVYGGFDFEGIWEGDKYQPKRFFSFYTDDEIQRVVGSHFLITDFRTLVRPDNNQLYQALLLKSPYK